MVPPVRLSLLKMMSTTARPSPRVTTARLTPRVRSAGRANTMPIGTAATTPMAIARAKGR